MGGAFLRRKRFSISDEAGREMGKGMDCAGCFLGPFRAISSHTFTRFVAIAAER